MDRTSGDTIVLCKHCPEAIEQDPEGGWKDQHGHRGCQHDGLFINNLPLPHTPLPAGMRGGV